MANAKRASMREGPLAALFRKTELDGEEGAQPAPSERAPEPESPVPPAPDPPVEARRPVPHPALEGPGQ